MRKVGRHLALSATLFRQQKNRQRERFGIVAGRVIRRRTGNLFPQRSRLNVSGGVPSLAIAPLPLQLCGRWAGISLCQPLYSVNKKTDKQTEKQKEKETSINFDHSYSAEQKELQKKYLLPIQKKSRLAIKKDSNLLNPNPWMWGGVAR